MSESRKEKSGGFDEPLSQAITVAFFGGLGLAAITLMWSLVVILT
jgi:hypothetical protein